MMKTNPPTDTETGPGVLETALAYTSALRMADNAILYKFLAKSVGLKHGVLPSFMAKPWGNVSRIAAEYMGISSVTSATRL
jgi:glutamine synthetase